MFCSILGGLGMQNPVWPGGASEMTSGFLIQGLVVLILLRDFIDSFQS